MDKKTEFLINVKLLNLETEFQIKISKDITLESLKNKCLQQLKERTPIRLLYKGNFLNHFSDFSILDPSFPIFLCKKHVQQRKFKLSDTHFDEFMRKSHPDVNPTEFPSLIHILEFIKANPEEFRKDIEESEYTRKLFEAFPQYSDPETIDSMIDFIKGNNLNSASGHFHNIGKSFFFDKIKQIQEIIAASDDDILDALMKNYGDTDSTIEYLLQTQSNNIFK